MLLRFMLLGMFAGPLAQAQLALSGPSTVDIFKWRADGTFDLGMVFNGARVNLKGGVREFGDTVEVTGGTHAAVVTTYRGFVSLIVSQLGRPEVQGQLYILERKNKDFEQMNDEPIRGVAASMPGDLTYALKRYSELKKWDPAEPSDFFRAMVGYFEAFPSKNFRDFVDSVEKGEDVVMLVQRPHSRAPAPGEVERQPPAVAQPRPRQPPPPPQPRLYGYDQWGRPVYQRPQPQRPYGYGYPQQQRPWNPFGAFFGQ